jgi:hypothetical protein
VNAAFDESDVESILSGVFHMNAHLADMAEDIHAIRLLLEDGNEEEEEEGDAGDDPLS